LSFFGGERKEETTLRESKASSKQPRSSQASSQASSHALKTDHEAGQEEAVVPNTGREDLVIIIGSNSTTITAADDHGQRH
jgi:hypothetical protein